MELLHVPAAEARETTLGVKRTRLTDINSAGILMVNHSPYSLVLTYTDDPRQLTIQAVDSSIVTPLVAGKMAVPFFVDEEEFRFDDELARQLGVAMLNLIAAGRPDVKKCLALTQRPIDRPSEK